MSVEEVFAVVLPREATMAQLCFGHHSENAKEAPLLVLPPLLQLERAQKVAEDEEAHALRAVAALGDMLLCQLCVQPVYHGATNSCIPLRLFRLMP